MSRLAIALALVTAVSSLATAEKVAPAAQLQTRPDDEPYVADRALVREKLAAARKANLATFHAYQLARVFPSNVYKTGELNVFRDKDGNLCAVATMMWKGGAHDLVNRVVDQNNFIKLVDVKQGPVMDWILTSGFTQEELVQVQRPGFSVSRRPVPDGGSVDAELRRRETDRMAGVYQKVEKSLVDNEQKSLDLATDRLMQHGNLAE